MIVLRYTVALALCAAIVGCSGASKSGTNAASPGAASQATAAAAAAPAGGGGGGDSTLPVYPGATKSAIQAPLTKYCGYSVATTLYSVGDSPAKVSSWYQGQMPGSTNVMAPSIGVAGTYMEISADRANAAMVIQTAGVKTQLVLAKYDPPISSDDIRMIHDAQSANATDRAAMAAKMKEKCKNQ